jgi:inorganic triphosphatase YgiF
MGTAMLERELKFYVSKGSRAALEKELRAAGARTIALRACYFDTDDRELAEARVALRVRKEGRRWVQTVKMPGPDELSRIEISHPRPGPEPDLGLYEGTEVEAVLKRLRKPLALRYETDVKRLVLRHESPAGVIEFAYDRGTIKAGGLTLPLCELELEQVSGETAVLLDQGRDWLGRHRLILDLRSKAERGDALARVALAHVPIPPDGQAEVLETVPEFAPIMLRPRKAGTVALQPSMSMLQAFLACATDCINQIVRNATFLAGVDSAQSTPALRTQHVHQLRVGIRRLRSCWTFFDKWVELDHRQLEADLRQFFSLLGRTRDDDVIRRTIGPRLAHAGMPGVVLADLGSDAARIGEVVGSPEFQASVLALVDQLLTVSDAIIKANENGEKHDAKPAPGAAALVEEHEGKLGKSFSKRLNRWLKRVCLEGQEFETLPIETQHAVRKKIKRLRYSMEFSAGVLSPKTFAGLRSAVADAQDRLGELNDLYVAQGCYAALVHHQPQAYFALGWLHAMQQHKKVEVHAALDRLCKTRRFKAAACNQ